MAWLEAGVRRRGSVVRAFHICTSHRADMDQIYVWARVAARALTHCHEVFGRGRRSGHRWRWSIQLVMARRNFDARMLEIGEANRGGLRRVDPACDATRFDERLVSR